MAEGFQQQVYPQPAPATEGDFADHNTRTTVTAGPGGLVAGAVGCVVGRFAWWDITVGGVTDPNGSNMIVVNVGQASTPVVGFVHREQQGLITNYLGGSSMMVPGGFPVTLYNEGAFWVKNTGAGAAVVGQKAFANIADGSVQFAAAGATVTGAVETKWICTSPGAPQVNCKITSWPQG